MLLKTCIIFSIFAEYSHTLLSAGDGSKTHNGFANLGTLKSFQIHDSVPTNSTKCGLSSTSLFIEKLSMYK